MKKFFGCGNKPNTGVEGGKKETTEPEPEKSWEQMTAKEREDERRYVADQLETRFRGWWTYYQYLHDLEFSGRAAANRVLRLRLHQIDTTVELFKKIGKSENDAIKSQLEESKKND